MFEAMADPISSVTGTKGGLAVAPSLEPSIETARTPPRTPTVDRRVVVLSVWAILIGLGAGLVARALVLLIGFITNVSFYRRLSFAFASPAGNQLGAWVILVPVVGGLDRRLHGALRLGGDPRTRHPRSDGAGALQREPHPAADDAS